MSSFFLSLFVICLIGVGQSYSCPFYAHFKNSTGSLGATSLANLSGVCATKLGLKIEDFNEEMFKNADADDKCLAKCLLQQLEIVSDTKLFDRDAFFELLEDQAPKSLLIKLTEIVNKCADSTQIDIYQIQAKKGKVYPNTGAASSSDGGNTGSCTKYHAFMVCFNTNAENLC